MNKEQVQLIASTLRFEFNEPAQALAIENATHFFVDSPAAARLLGAVQRGDWQFAATRAASVIASHLVDAAVLEIESCHVVETLVTQGGAAAMQVIKHSARPEHAAQLGLILFNPPQQTEGLREQLCNRLRHMLGPEHTVPTGRLSALLYSALKFRQLEENGGVAAVSMSIEQKKVRGEPVVRDVAVKDEVVKDEAVRHEIMRDGAVRDGTVKDEAANDAVATTVVPKDLLGKDVASKDMAVKAYVVEAVVSLLLESHANPLVDLQALCGISSNINTFGSEAVDDLVRTVVRQALAQNCTEAIAIMRQRDSSREDLIGHIFGELFASGKSTQRQKRSKYNYLERYAQHRTPDLPVVDSVLQLGQVVEAALHRYTLRVPQQSLFMPIADQPAQFPTQIVRRLRPGSEAWVVAFNHDGSMLAVGCADATLILYRVEHSPFSIVRDRTQRLTAGIHRLAWHPSTNKLLAEDIFGWCLLWDVDRGLEITMETRDAAEGVPATGNGDVAWHPTDEDLFFRVERDCTISLRHADTDIVKWGHTLNEPLQSVAPTVNHQLAVLTGKTDETPQRILILDNYDAPAAVDYYDLPFVDGEFTSLQSSRWDPRTLLLMGPNRAVLLLDVLGKREPVALRGPLQNESIIRPVFAGPLDKFILSGSEEKSSPETWVFNRFTGETVARFQDHKACVNSVDLHINDKTALLVSGSDDMDVIIYAAQTDSNGSTSTPAPFENGHSQAM